MHPRKATKFWTWFAPFLAFSLWCSSCKWSEAESIAGNGVAEASSPKLPALPVHFPDLTRRYGDEKSNPYRLENLTIVPELQEQLESYIHDHGNPIAAVVLVDVKTGGILAMAQGRSPKEWGGEANTALHSGFPAASLFKTIVAAAGFEIAEMDAEAPIGLAGSCADVHPRGSWLRQGGYGRVSRMTLHRAYGNSCNGFFAKIAVNQIGLGSIASVAKRFGWDGRPIPTDFHIAPSPIKFPNPTTSSVHTVGRFAAGFGYVGTSAVHVAWQIMALANGGEGRPIRIFKDSTKQLENIAAPQVVSAETAGQVRGLMDATILGGTASFAFRHGKYRKLRQYVGGKTGTLTGHSPKGLTTWFAGLMPLEDPQVAVATVVVLEDLWRFKAAHLAAEAFLDYAEHAKMFSSSLTSAGKRGERL